MTQIVVCFELRTRPSITQRTRTTHSLFSSNFKRITTTKQKTKSSLHHHDSILIIIHKPSDLIRYNTTRCAVGSFTTHLFFISPLFFSLLFCRCTYCTNVSYSPLFVWFFFFFFPLLSFCFLCIHTFISSSSFYYYFFCGE